MTELVLRDTAFTDPAIEAQPVSIRHDRPTLRAAGPLIAFDIARDFASFEALEEEWNALFAASGRPEQVFQSFAWNWHWARHYLAAPDQRSQGPQLAIVTGRLDGQLALVFPLVTERVAGLTQLSWMGEPVSQYGDVIAAPEASSTATLLAAWQFAMRETRADFANLRKVRADALIAPVLAELGMRIVTTDEAPYLELSPFDDAAAFASHLATKGRSKNRRRQLRRLQDLGPVAFEVHQGTEDAARLAGDAIAMKRQWLTATQQVSLALADDRFLAFFADAAGGRGKTAPVEVRVLRSNGAIAAVQILLHTATTRFLHFVVYSEKFEKCGAGSLLLERTVSDCHREGLATFDLLPPKYDYKQEFSDGVVLVHDHALAMSIAGRIYVACYLGFRRRIKMAIEAAPGPVRQAIGRALAALKRTN